MSMVMTTKLTKDVQTLVDAALASGWRVAATKRHLVLKAGDGQGIVTIASTPSDHRAIKNIRSELRRRGVNC